MLGSLSPCAGRVCCYTFEERVFEFLDPLCDETWALKGAKNDESASEAMIYDCCLRHRKKDKKRKRKEKECGVQGNIIESVRESI